MSMATDDMNPPADRARISLCRTTKGGGLVATYQSERQRTRRSHRGRWLAISILLIAIVVVIVLLLTYSGGGSGGGGGGY
jgi:hypothetical protein